MAKKEKKWKTMPKPKRDSNQTVEEPWSEYRLEDGTIIAPPEPHVINEIPRKFLDRYKLLRPIPIKFEHEEPESCVAVFKEANISMTGYSKSNARDELTYTIMDFLEVFRDDPDFTKDVKTVLSYIKERHVTEK